MDGEDGEQSCDEDAADCADDRTGGFDVASIDDELCSKGDGGTNEKGPEENVRGGNENEGDEPLCDEQDGEEEDKECLASRHAAKEDEECGEAEQQPEDGGQTVVVDDGVARTLGADDDILACLRVDVECGIVHRHVDERCFAALIWPGVQADADIILRAAGGKCGCAARDLLHSEDLCLVGRRVAVLAGRQIEEKPAEGAKGETDGEEAREALRMDFHGRCLSLCRNARNYHTLTL